MMRTPARTCDQDYAALLRRHYAPAPRPGATTARSTSARAVSRQPGRASVALSADNGVELLGPAPVDDAFEEYVVDRPEPPEEAQPPEPARTPVPDRSSGSDRPPEAGRPAEPPAAPATAPAGSGEPDRPPGKPDALDGPRAAHSPVQAPAEPQAQGSPPPRQGSGGRAGSDAPAGGNGSGPAASPRTTGAPSPQDGGRRSSLGDDDLAADMQAILSGQGVYDPETRQVRPSPGRGPRAADPPAPPERPVPEARNDQAIFDRIAQSMEHANSFDLGTVELGRRFGRFDQAHERRRTPPRTAAGAAAPASAPAKPAPVASGVVASDLAAISRDWSGPMSREELRSAYDRRGPWSGIPGRDSACGASSLALALAPERSSAMYDTGEHVLAAGDLYPDRLVLGGSPGVAFSYGQIVAMPDFYESVDQLLAAPPAELSRLEVLIERNTEYYRGNRRDPSKDVSHDEWDAATGGRYLRLADVNYAHFSPASLLGMSGGGREATNRSRWEELHRRAIREMQDLVLAHRDATPFPAGPLITNAFADHFLTDAFAAGHVINKEVVIERFRSRFFTGAELNDDARTFFDQVARRAYTGRVAERFSQLEPTQLPLCAGGFCLPVRPNIRTAGMFAQVLKQAAEAEPVKIANLAVKIVHDKLNRDGLEVVNDAGDPAWRLTGDGSLNPTSLAVMRRAVQQSVDNINDPAILASDLDPAPFLARVWRHVPRPTSAAVAQATRVVESCTDPRDADLVTATADLITEQLDALVQALLDSGRMQED